MPENGFYGFPCAQSEPARDFRASGKPGATAGVDLAGGTTTGAPTSGYHKAGEFIVDQAAGTIWICTATGLPGTWTQVVGGSGTYTLPDATTTTIGGLDVDETPASGHPVALSTQRYQMPHGVPALGGDGLIRSLSQQSGADAGITETSRWTRAASAILVATAGWEGTAVVEPSVLFDAGTWKMWYRGGWLPAGVGYATCPGTSDPTVAANWTKYGSNPVIGGAAQQPTVLKVNGTFWIFYPDSSKNLKVAQSSDGLTWGAATTALAVAGSVTQWANSAVWVENGTQWKMLLEGQISGVWQIHLATSSDGLTWTLGNGGSPLSTLQVHSSGSYGGPCVPNPPKYNGRYEVWYHAVNAVGGLPTNLYRASSTDLITWTPYAASPVLTHTGTGFEIDQVADPEVAEVYGTSYLFYDGDDNSGAGAASIGVCSFAGPLATLVGQGALPAPLDSGGKVPVADLPTATSSTLGIVKPDGSTVTISAGVLSSSAAADPTTTEGDLLYRHSGTLARLGVGASGQALVANGTDPLWGQPLPSSLLVVLPNANSFVVDGPSAEQPPDFITTAAGDVIGVGGL